MTQIRTPNIWNSQAGTPFARNLAAHCLEETKDNPETLATYQIILPTRRACRILIEAFTSQNNGKALLLPNMYALSDLEDAEQTFKIGGPSLAKQIETLPQAIPPLKRQILLARTIENLPLYKGKTEQSLKLAQALGQFLDHIYTENLNLDTLKTLSPDTLAHHWQITLDFLKIISEHWPKILKEQGQIDGADRRNRLILKLADHWQKNPPRTPIIAAGTTGSIPATAQLLKTIAHLPHGHIILPGLDQNIDDPSWEAITEDHPQYGLKNLLEILDVQREYVQPLKQSNTQNIQTDRITLAREVMRPAATSDHWQTLKHTEQQTQTLKTSLKNLTLVECAHKREEALTIAIALRQILQTPNKTAVLITPDRILAKRVTAQLKRWNITIDDSAGKPLTETSIAKTALQILKFSESGTSPVLFLSLLKTNAFDAQSDFIDQIDKALRGPKPCHTMDELSEYLTQKHPGINHTALEEFTAPIKKFTIKTNGIKDIQTHIAHHLELINTLTQNMTEAQHEAEGSQELLSLISEIKRHTNLFPTMTRTQYGETLKTLMETITVRSNFGTHPRLQILGQLEARLIDADHVILAGLNEGTWPPDPGHDPWMSRPMRKEFGLPSPERHIGLAAHDFVQGLCTSAVLITRSKREDGKPTIPSRWLQRLSAVLSATNIPHTSINNEELLGWVKIIDKASDQTPCPRPAPAPPLKARPTHLSATQIETWINNPYAIYARKILNLKPLKPLEQPFDASLKGTCLHLILERFTQKHPEAPLKKDVHTLHQDFKEIAHKVINETFKDPALWTLWWPRLSQIGYALIDHEKRWRENWTPALTETKGTLTLKTLTLTAIADRIDQSSEGLALIDYKSGGQFSKTAIKDGRNPQLPVEALIATQGTFKNLTCEQPTQTLQYWVLKGGQEALKITAVDDEIDTIIENTYTDLLTLINTYNDEQTPYHCRPNPENIPRFDDYEHFSRVREWGITKDSNESDVA